MSEKVSGSFVTGILKGVAVALIVALVGVLIFAGVVKIAKLNDTVIKAGNQFIKILAIFIGCIVGVKESRGLVKGALIGGLFSIVVQLIFAIMGSVEIGAHFFIDIGFSIVIGALLGIIVLTLTSKRR